ncbi:MAG: maltose alpha-D-glucosyltransferase [Verrucomicrobia bacterium]|nr:maltose alpha-D-glucosyltransferase [Verrucomicrobiota bacterium]
MRTATTAPGRNAGRQGLDPDPFWYKTGVIYELHVRAFCDSDGNGVGDFKGLTGKLDYLKDLGVTALWLLPFYPSPLRDDGYDIADYYAVHPSYGTLADFKTFLRAAHQRGLRVITELVMNHTSDQHPWFQRARRGRPGSRWREFYVWSDTPDKYKDTRVIFKDVEASNWAWDPVANAYYWHRFFAHQPDLNYDNPEVFDTMVQVLDFWLDLGVDGVRLDAVPYLYEREGTSCENLPETHAALKRLRAHVDARYGDRMLLAEANQWPEDAVAYFGERQGDECHMAFHFPLMPRLFMAVRMEDRTPIVDILEQTPPIPETAQWALFLRNHDELTLEMVTDEERDYMYRMYAHVHQARLNLGIRRRLAPLLGNDRKRIELLNALLFSLPGTPVLYYGDEIGLGENIYLGDRNGVRTPMQWSSDKNAGFSRANPQALYLPIIYDPQYHYEAVNVEGQLGNPHSLLWWMRRLLALRKKWRALGEGKCEFLQPENRRILSYVLRDAHETLLVVANLSRFVQPVQLDLSAFRQRVPVELFGRTEFPPISDQPYLLTLGPHAFYWFSLESRETAAAPGPAAGAAPRALSVAGPWTAVFRGKARSALEGRLADFMAAQRWFGGKAKTLKQLALKESIPVPVDGREAGFLALVQVDYVQGDSEFYSIPLAFAAGADAQRLREESPQMVIAELGAEGGGAGVIYDGVSCAAFCEALLDMVVRRRHSKGTQGDLEGSRTPALRRLLGDAPAPPPVPCKAEQSNSSVVYGDKLILKLFRRLDAGVNPDLELGRFLTAREFPHVPPLAGALEYLAAHDDRLTLAVVYGYLRDAKDAWLLTLDSLGRYYDRIGVLHAKGEKPPPASHDLLRLCGEEFSPAVQELIGTYLEYARLLGRRTAALHLALASETEDSSLAPEPFTPHYMRGLFQSMRNLATHNLRLLRRQLKSLPADVAPMAERAAALESAIVARYRPLFERRISAKRIRIHGDYHLGQVLWTGKDFVILDFEGEPAVPLTERRIKRSPLQDVAGMIRSFHYAAYAGLNQQVERGSLAPENLAHAEPWARFWNHAVSAAFLRAYLEAVGKSEVLPQTDEELRVMLPAYLLNKAVYELGYEMNHRPAWLKIPLQGILHLMEEPS